MQRLLILLVSITVLSGCAYRDPISISQTMPE
ncbi:lipoprotein [Sutterella wadsworthensis]